MRGGELILWPLERRLLLRQRFEPTDFEGALSGPAFYPRTIAV